MGETERGGVGGTFRLAPDVVFERVEGSAVLIHLGTNRMFELDAAGTRLWELLSGGNDLDGAEASLLQEYDVDPDVLHREIGSTIDRLLSEGLVVRAGTA